MTRGTDLITAERERQLRDGDEPWMGETNPGKIATAGAAYAFGQGYELEYRGEGGYGRQYLDKVPAGMWPWSWEWWRPSRTALRTLVRAGAMIAAAIDRLLEEDDASLAAAIIEDLEAVPVAANDHG